MKRRLTLAIAFLLPFLVPAQSPSYYSESILHAQTNEIKNAKVHTCTAVDSTSGGITWGDYFVFDTAGRVLREDLRSLGRGRSDVRTFAYDTVAHGKMTITEYVSTGWNMFDTVNAGLPPYYNRDSIVARAQPHKWDLYRNDRDPIHTIYYDEKGRIETEFKPYYDQNDTIRQLDWFDAGYVRETWVYGPDGKLIRDSSFEYYVESLYTMPGDEERMEDTGATKSQVSVEYYDRFENAVRYKVITPEGDVHEDDTVLLVYDDKGRCTSSTRKNSKGEVTEYFTRVYDASGNVVQSVDENKVSGSKSMISIKYVINNTDTIIYRHSSYWFPHEQKFRITYSTHWITHSKNRTVSRTVTYETDPANKIIGDTTVEIQTTNYDKNWRVINYETVKNGKQASAGSCEYNKEGKMISYTRTENGYARRETWSYYPDGTLKENKIPGITREYTPSGKLAKVSNYYSNQPPYLVYVYTYDQKGMLIRSETIENGVTTEVITYRYTYYR